MKKYFQKIYLKYFFESIFYLKYFVRPITKYIYFISNEKLNIFKIMKNKSNYCSQCPNTYTYTCIAYIHSLVCFCTRRCFFTLPPFAIKWHTKRRVPIFRLGCITVQIYLHRTYIICDMLGYIKNLQFRCSQLVCGETQFHKNNHNLQIFFFSHTVIIWHLIDHQLIKTRFYIYVCETMHIFIFIIYIFQIKLFYQSELFWWRIFVYLYFIDTHMCPR